MSFASSLKENMNKIFGMDCLYLIWRMRSFADYCDCFIYLGRHFGSFISYESKSVILFWINQIGYLIFKFGWYIVIINLIHESTLQDVNTWQDLSIPEKERERKWMFLWLFLFLFLFYFCIIFHISAEGINEE